MSSSAIHIPVELFFILWKQMSFAYAIDFLSLNIAPFNPTPVIYIKINYSLLVF